MVKDVLTKLSSGQTLTFEETSAFVDQIAVGEVSHSQIAAFLTGLRMRGETVAELAGCVESLRRRAIKVPHHQALVMDCCGTGGDGSHSFNISTAASIVIASCGVAMAKHGNRAVSSACGSADILEAAGANLNLNAEQAAQLLDEVGYCFLFAPNFHPAMKHVAPVRKELGFRTCFNLLGPLLNPAQATHQMIGTATTEIAEKLASTSQYFPNTKIVTVHNSLGFDEILPTGDNHRYQWLDDNLFSDMVALPLHLQNGYLPADLAGGNAAGNLAILHRVLSGEKSAYLVATILNAGFGLIVAEQAHTLEQGSEMAVDAIVSGKARKMLADYVSASNEVA